MPMPIFDTQEAVPEAFRAEYEEREGKWHPKIPDVAKLEKSIADEREKAETERKARNKAEGERDALKRAKDAKDKGITEEQLADIQSKEAAARKPIEEERDRLAAENRKLKLTDRVKALALAAGVMPDRITKAMKDLESRVDLTEDGNSIVVKDAAGKVTAETIEDFLGKTYKSEAPFFYAGTGAPGSGAEGSSSSSGAQNGSYDPVAAGKAAAKEQKKTAGDNALAFR